MGIATVQSHLALPHHLPSERRHIIRHTPLQRLANLLRVDGRTKVKVRDCFGVGLALGPRAALGVDDVDKVAFGLCVGAFEVDLEVRDAIGLREEEAVEGFSVCVEVWVV